jgi:hypothetical protein
VKILATALALGIAIDALIVRALLAPALVVLLGRLNWSLPRPLAVAATFVLVVLGWVLFRMHSASAIGDLYAGMLGLHGVGGAPGHLLAYIAVSFALVFGLPEEWRWPVERWRPALVAAAAVLFVVAATSVYTSEPFIYFRF